MVMGELAQQYFDLSFEQSTFSIHVYEPNQINFNHVFLLFTGI